MSALSRHSSVITPTITVANPVVLGVRGGVRLERGCWQGHEVFVKSLSSSDPDFRVRFHHEGRVVQRLMHPAIVPLLAHTQEQLVFPFIEGCSLRELLDSRRLSVAEAVSVTQGVLTAARFFHAQGVTHHDLKPENVMLLGGVASAECVRVADFGMAHDKRLKDDLHAGTRMGTPQFMAPEQFQGVRGDARSDLYAAGGLLFDCLAGEPPHPDALGWLVGLSSERLPLPGPNELHPVIERALQRDPAQRPQTAQQMAALLSEAWAAIFSPSTLHREQRRLKKTHA
ncbi:serine/threonine protein kinase [Deinococcus detaillensis]|uniref:Serine/threonine protein kinase n=1 Tax=Deinococcus detaillensis TaxID=2592048 RepID=A0A553V0C0_9DEIO|nr:serine/threonine-protein kinase [Deinococcus detaillensis]TSA85900.1 serine/threonine protein kinase [Deinococcus detaillensis]